MSVEDTIKKQISENPILIYMKGNPQFPQCGFSAAVVNVFNQLGVKYQTVDVIADPEIREGIKAFSNWPTIPQIYIQGKFIGGCDIIREMNSRGELKPLAEAAATSH